MAVAEKGNAPVHILSRGNPRLKAAKVSTAFPAVLSPPEPKIEKRKDSSGKRRAFAEWLVSRDNPLTARVMVNRIWQYHFGTGIVASANDFGLSQVLNENPKVYISESDLIPGYLNKLQVPPNSFLASIIRYDFSGFFLSK